MSIYGGQIIIFLVKFYMVIIMFKLNKEKIFIYISIIFLLSISGFFLCRFIYFYRLSHDKKIKSNDLYEILLEKRAILNLHKVDNSYYFTGNNSNNYIIYSGMLWRIIKLENKQLQLISDIPVTNLYFNNNHNDFLLDEYLNNDFYQLLDKRLIVDTEICTHNDEKNECNNKYKNKVVLLSLDTYDITGGIDSFINNGYYTYLINTNDNKYYINDMGKINVTFGNDLYGIKPVITINSDDIINGDGTISNPYLLDKPANNLKYALVGSYVMFSNKLFRITSNGEYAKLVLDDVLNYDVNASKYSTNSNIYKYLNNDFYNILDKDKIVSIDWYNGYYDNSYDEIKNSTINCNVAISNIGDLFLNDKSNYVLMSISNLEETMYIIKNNGIVYEESDLKEYGIRPVLAIKNNLKLTGIGTKNNPYIVGDVINEENN